MGPVYFTKNVATNASFCNRTEEQKMLIHAVEKNQHVVLMAPRRYGKTSLVVNTLSRHRQLYACVDFFCVVYEEEICHKVAKAVSELIGKLTPFSTRSLQCLSQYFKLASIAIKAGRFDIKIETDKTRANPAESLEDLLSGLEKVAAKHKKPVVLFLDEFQDILKTGLSDRIQAAIRSIAQHSRFVTYVFSGSSRTMLKKIFEDKKQPLYMLCKKMVLERIAPAHFISHINAAFSKRFKKPIATELINVILQKTECHSYYVNVLCDKLWENDMPPTIAHVEKAWRETIEENTGKIIADLSPLNTNRLKILTMIAQLEYVKEPNAKYFLDRARLSLSSAQTAFQYLLDYDFIFETPEGYTLVDPAMKVFLNAN